MHNHEAKEFENEVRTWVRSERASRDDFIFRPLNNFPRYETNQTFPSCQIPCYHFFRGQSPLALHRTIAKDREHTPHLLNTLYDLSVSQYHNQYIIHDGLVRLSKYVVTKGIQAVQAIPTGKTVLEGPSVPTDGRLSEIQAQIASLRGDLISLKADLREIRSNQTYQKAAFSQLQQSLQEIISRESDPKPIEATTAEVAEQLKQLLQQVQANAADTHRIAQSLIPE